MPYRNVFGGTLNLAQRSRRDAADSDSSSFFNLTDGNQD